MAMFPIEDGNKPSDRLVEMFGPAQIDHMIRQAVQFCWMGLPEGCRSVDEVEAQIRRITERALKDFREDRAAFGKTDDS